MVQTLVITVLFFSFFQKADTTSNDSLLARYNYLYNMAVLEKNGEKSLIYSIQAYTIAQKLSPPILMANAALEISFDYANLGNYTASLKYAVIAAEICEKLNDNTGLGLIYSQIGNIYMGLANYQLAIAYYRKSMRFYKPEIDAVQIGNIYNNLGECYRLKQTTDTAIYFYQKAYNIFKNLANRELEVAYVECGIGLIYQQQGKTNQCDSIINVAFSKLRKLNDVYAICITRFEMAKYAFSTGNFATAQVNANEAYIISKENFFRKETGEISLLLSEIALKNNDFKMACTYQKQYLAYKDSLANEAIISQVAEMRAEFEISRNEKEINYLKSIGKLHRIVMLILSILVVCIGIIGWILWKLFTRSKSINKLLSELNSELNQRNEEIVSQMEEIQSQSIEIEKQKNLVEQKNKNLFSSIMYAHRIQQSILPQYEKIKAVFPESFVMYEPKDIVSGDFYWIYEINSRIFFAVVDCTGHGVPGAFMSILAHDLLKKAIHETGVNTPAEILNIVSHELNLTLRKESREQNVKDGMDIALCSYFPEKFKLEFAGSHIPLLIIREGQIQKILPDRHSIGEPLTFGFNSFTNHHIQIQPNDSLYMFTDGYIHQFGGPKGKKFSTSQFENLLIQVYNKPAKEQKGILTETFLKWTKGYHKVFEQTDDITVLGIKL